MLLVKNWPFFNVFFLASLGQENVFYDILERKMPFWAIKTRSSKSRKIETFLKGLTHAFGQKLAIFPSFFFRHIDQENVYYDILEQKNAFLGYKKRSSKSRKIEIYPKGLTHGFSEKLAIFPSFFF